MAADDLSDVLQHSEETWGVEQRDVYAATIAAALDRLVQFPELGRPRDDLRPGLRGLVVERHVVLYRVDAELVRVLRIVHQRRGKVRIPNE